MKIVNNNVYKVMFNNKFINPGEVIEMVDQKLLKILLSQPGIEEYADINKLKEIEKENEKLKSELEKATNKTTKTTKSASSKSSKSNK